MPRLNSFGTPIAISRSLPIEKAVLIAAVDVADDGYASGAVMSGLVSILQALRT
jgi:hypothetical protein